MIFCRRCGTYSTKGTGRCPRCEADLSAFGHQSLSGASPLLGEVSVHSAISNSPTIDTDSAAYGSFGNRFLAILVDSLLLTVVTSIPMGLVIFGIMGMGPRRLTQLGAALWLGLTAFAIFFLLPVAYEVLMIAKKGATYGKAFRRLVVVRTSGEPVSIGRSLVRVLIKMFLSGFLLIGYLMPLFTAKKQALHDMIADTVVVQAGS